MVTLRDHFVGNVRLAVALLAGAGFLVLLISCFNVVNLLMARGSARDRELAIRVALGAGRWRLLRQLFSETFILAAIAGLAGTLLAHWMLTSLAHFGPRSVPWIEMLHLDIRAVWFAVAVTLVVTLLAGALPAWRTAVTSLQSAGRATATDTIAQHHLRTGLVIGEIALALVLACGASLLLRSFTKLMNVDPGFRRDNVLVLQVFAYGHYPTPAHLRAFFDQAATRLRALPGVESVGAVSALPFIESNIDIQSDIAIVGRPTPEPGESARSHLTIVTPGYFETLRIPLRQGRLFDARDGADTKPVAVVSEAVARRHWPDSDPIGRRIRTQFTGRAIDVEVVGVTAALRHDRLDSAARNEIFLPHAQNPFGSMTFAIRTATDPAVLIQAAKSEIWAVSPAQTIYHTATLDQLVIQTISPRRFALTILAAFALVALLLSAGGVYGVLSAIITTRLRELGVRIALGATRWQVAKLVIGRGFAIAGCGLVIGLCGFHPS